MSIPTLERPLFKGMSTLEEYMTASMKEYETLKETDENGLDFSNKTAMWIAYERYVESQRSDALFHDPLAQYFMEPYGKRLSDAMSIGLALRVFDPPSTEAAAVCAASTGIPPIPKLSDVGTNLGFGLEGHVMYTAARTKLINDQVDQWIVAHPKGQIVNLGAGFDARQYWLQSLSNAVGYWEIDTQSIMSYKQRILEGLPKEVNSTSLCPCHSIPTDFSKEKIPHKLFEGNLQNTIPTCWILEGLIMYLQRDQVMQLMNDLCSSNLSCNGSLLILNFSNNTPNGPSIDEISQQLTEHHWEQQERLMFGDVGFQFDRYPAKKPANRQLGIATFLKMR